MARFALLVAALIAASINLAAQSLDPHSTCTRTGAITRRSAFAHGYLHGYEQGFHLADIDFQMGRPVRDISKLNVAKEVRERDHYGREFGDNHSFKDGYREGARVGYADGIAGRAFRAFDQLNPILQSATDSAVGIDAVFDRGFSQGYVSGQRQGLTAGRRDVTFTNPLPQCPSARQEENPQEFCSAYVGGYRVGYADGFTNVARPATAQVENRAGK
jgi:flagellar biosynthesis/type III secretory pathway protein FliH